MIKYIHEKYDYEMIDLTVAKMQGLERILRFFGSLEFKHGKALSVRFTEVAYELIRFSDHTTMDELNKGYEWWEQYFKISELYWNITMFPHSYEDGPYAPRHSRIHPIVNAIEIPTKEKYKIHV